MGDDTFALPRPRLRFAAARAVGRLVLATFRVAFSALSVRPAALRVRGASCTSMMRSWGRCGTKKRRHQNDLGAFALWIVFVPSGVTERRFGALCIHHAMAAAEDIPLDTYTKPVFAPDALAGKVILVTGRCFSPCFACDSVMHGGACAQGVGAEFVSASLSS